MKAYARHKEVADDGEQTDNGVPAKPNTRERDAVLGIEQSGNAVQVAEAFRDYGSPVIGSASTQWAISG